MSARADSTKVVIAALAGNLLIATSKFVAAFLTGSAATLAEAVHSCADTGNQVLLLFGMKLSLRRPTEQHPFGRAIERYFWAFVVSIMLFTVGGVFAVFEGYHKLLAVTEHTDVVHGSNLWNYVVLGVSAAFETYSFLVAMGEFRKLRGQRSTLRAMIESRDPTIPVVVLEDSAALAGLFLALVGIGLSDLTGWRGFDGIASLLIGVLLCGVAVFLANETHSLIVGESATPADRAKVRRIVEAVAGVRAVTQMLSMHRGPDDVILALKVDFERALEVGTIEQTINDIETRVREELPHMRHIFVEPDATYRAALDEEFPKPKAQASSEGS